jgi:hypothetical protein
MIENTFVHLPGIGAQTELRLWEQGILTWDALSEALPEMYRGKKAEAIARALDESRVALDAMELEFFSSRLAGEHMWRLAPHCLKGAAYLDIESTGLGHPPIAHSTTIAVSMGGELFVEHDPEKKRELVERLDREAKLLVTFNGACFDLPFLRSEFGVGLRNPHVDLRIWFRRLGITGGLKKIQASFPEIHQRDSMDIDGYDAVKLWRMHQRGVPNALETLMTYNAEDAIVLEPLMHLAYAREVEAHPHLTFERWTEPELPAIKTNVSEYVYQLLRGREEWNVPPGW